MHPVSFPGSVEVRKPESMTDEQCMSVWAKMGFGKLFELCKVSENIIVSVHAGVDQEEYPFFLTAWKPSYEDLKAFNRGGELYIKTLSRTLPPMSVFTLDENDNCNDAG